MVSVCSTRRRSVYVFSSIHEPFQSFLLFFCHFLCKTTLRFRLARDNGWQILLWFRFVLCSGESGGAVRGHAGRSQTSAAAARPAGPTGRPLRCQTGATAAPPHGCAVLSLSSPFRNTATGHSIPFRSPNRKRFPFEDSVPKNDPVSISNRDTLRSPTQC